MPATMTNKTRGPKRQKNTDSHTACEIWIIVDENGGYVTENNSNDVRRKYAEEVGGSSARHMVCLTVTVPLPETTTINTEVPASASTTLITVS